MAKNCNVARVADLLREVRCVVDVFGLKKGVFLFTLEHTEVDGHAQFVQGLVDEPGVARLIARHVAHQGLYVRVTHVLLDFLIKHAARILRRDRRHEQVEKLFLQLGICLEDLWIIVVVLLEVAAVLVEFKVSHHEIPLGTHR